MKKVRKVLAVIIILSFVFSIKGLAGERNLGDLPGRYNQSVLLDQSIKSAKDIFRGLLKGEILSMGMIEIVNKQNGDILIQVDTFAHRDVDKILHTVFLEYWDKGKNEWVQVDHWNFSEERGDRDSFTMLSTSFTVNGYPLERFYRVRGLHMVQLGEETEGCYTETDGILITDHPT